MRGLKIQEIVELKMGEIKEIKDEELREKIEERVKEDAKAFEEEVKEEIERLKKEFIEKKYSEDELVVVVRYVARLYESSYFLYIAITMYPEWNKELARERWVRLDKEIRYVSNEYDKEKNRKGTEIANKLWPYIEAMNLAEDVDRLRRLIARMSEECNCEIDNDFDNY
ncbi:MAG: hypothetical protein JHC26_10395 [Thermofilum sp.]|uniref:hypothetical protein n=1 Tax=Thermofilum sp. TaxID=1961369 RepID=UPI00258B08EC|nr:hypothetical protein [Thermofilum sp.]MCI4409489.1 hypothetical protein [Thermofilum sp.]